MKLNNGGLFRSKQIVAWIGCIGAALALGSGCASSVPGSANTLNSLSGKQIKVSITFRHPVNPNYHYFFLINNTGSTSGAWPQPVGTPVSGQGYGNGFATGSDGKSGGFTDFVLYSNNQVYGGQPSGNFALYHVANGTNANNSQNFNPNGVPLNSSVSADGATLTFVLDLAQLYPSPISQSTAFNLAQNLRWIQVNCIATNVVPVEGQTSIAKAFDSFGDDSSGVGGYLLMDLKTQSVYANNDGTAATFTCSEPANDDIFISPAGSTNQDPSLDIIDWNIQIVNTAS